VLYYNYHENHEYKKAGFILDMDSVIYKDKMLISGTIESLEKLKGYDIPYLFLTNNSQRTRRDLALKISRLGLIDSEEDMMTCDVATARFLAEKDPNATAFAIGENGLAATLHHNGMTVVDENPSYVVIGEGRTINFENIEKAVLHVHHEAKLIATKLDATCPTDNGIRPGCGAIVAMIESATGKKAYSLGKPSPIMMRIARKAIGLRTDETIMVGNTMHTDILGAVEMGYRSAIVLSGHTAREDIVLYS